MSLNEKSPSFPFTFFGKKCDLPQCSPYQAVTGKIYLLKQQQATFLAACNLLMVY